jgi:O-antigen/teichoic acid export membrane protein
VAQRLAGGSAVVAAALGRLVVSGRAAEEARSYGVAAGMLTAALATAGLLTYGFFALASHNLSADDYGLIVVMWSVVFISVSVLFRPVEQLVSRTIAELETRGEHIGHAMRVAGTIQAGLAVLFVVLAFALRDLIEDDLLEGNEFLFYAMVGAVLAFGASFLARGFLAGERRFGLFSLLLIVDGSGRVLFSLAVAVGIAEGVEPIAIGVIAGPSLSLLVVPAAIRSPRPEAAAAPPADDTEPARPAMDTPDFTLAHGAGFAAAVLLIMLSEQIFLSSGALFARAEAGAAAAGFMFNILMVARAPVVLFQAVAASLLPHLTRLRSKGDESSEDAFRLSVRLTIVVIAGLAALLALVLLAAGPELMQIAFGDKFTYDRVDLVIVAVGMGFYLSAATLNQAALAQGQARRAAACWVTCAAGFVVWNLVADLDVFRQVEVGFAAGAAALCGLLYLLYRNPHPHPGDEVLSGSSAELEARLAAADDAV